MKRIFLPLLLSSAIASADVLTGLSVASQLFHLKEHNPDNDINKEFRHDGRTADEWIRHVNRIDPIRTYKVYDDLIDYEVKTVYRRPVKPKEETNIKTTEVKTCDENNVCKTTVTVVTDRLKTEIIR
jgi:hypothetical protein